MNKITDWGPYKAVVNEDGTLVPWHDQDEDPMVIKTPGQFFEYNHTKGHEGPPREIIDVAVIDRRELQRLQQIEASLGPRHTSLPCGCGYVDGHHVVVCPAHGG